MSDDGLGVRVIQCLSERYEFPREVVLLDGGTLGLDLLPYIESADRLLMVDAVETGEPPGSVSILRGEDIPVVMETKLSPHQMGLKDLLAVAMLRGHSPPEMVLFGLQPANIDLGMELSPEVAARFEELVEMVLRELDHWGVPAKPLTSDRAPMTAPGKSPRLTSTGKV